MLYKRFISISIIVLFIILAGCTSKNTREKFVNENPTHIGKPTTGDWLVRVLSSEPGTLNPITAVDAYESRVNEFIYETLLERDNKTLQLKPKLATNYKISDNKLEYTFYLRRDVKFHDGVKMTAKDVKFSFDIMTAPETDDASIKNYYKDVKSCKILNDYTVKFNCSKKYFLMLDILGSIPVIPKHIFSKGNFNQHPYGRKPLGTGKYIFKEWKTGEKIILERNKDYWGKGAYLDKIVFKIITDPTANLESLKKGDIDFSGLTAIQFVRQTSSPKFSKMFRKTINNLPQYSYIGWNNRSIFFNDRRVRLAMTKLLNRKEILESVLYGLGRVVNSPVYYASEFYNKELSTYKFNPQEAKKLLNEAGWLLNNKTGKREKLINGKKIPFKFTFLISQGSDTGVKIATIFKENLKTIGIDMEIKLLEWASFLEQIKEKKYDACTLGWSLSINVDPYQLWHSSQIKNGSNHVCFSNKEVDTILEKGREEFDKEKRKELYNRFQEIIHREQPYTFLFSPAGLGAVKRRFQNVNLYSIRPGYDVSEWYVPKKMQKYK